MIVKLQFSRRFVSSSIRYGTELASWAERVGWRVKIWSTPLLTGRGVEVIRDFTVQQLPS